MIDYHLHTNYSPDGDMDMELMVKRACDAGITHIAITDHNDFFPDLRKTDWEIQDVEQYKNDIKIIQEKYPNIKIAKGVEIGYIDEAREKITQLIDDIEPDFIINSCHLIGGVDPYFGTYFDNKTIDEAHIEYLECIYQSVKHIDNRANVIGHIGYTSRYAKFDNPWIHYNDYPQLIDDILSLAISKDMGIEINTNGYNSYDEPMPTYSVIRRYKELGGEILTIGSDAHHYKQIGQYYDKTIQMLKSIGFEYLTVFDKLEPEFIKI